MDGRDELDCLAYGGEVIGSITDGLKEWLRGKRMSQSNYIAFSLM